MTTKKFFKNFRPPVGQRNKMEERDVPRHTHVAPKFQTQNLKELDPFSNQ